MKSNIFTISLLFFTTVMFLNAETIKIYPILDGYTAPITGGNNMKTNQVLPRMADANTKPVMRFDLFFFAADYAELALSDIIKAELVVVSVLEGGPTGTSRRLSDGNVTVYETNNNWSGGAIVPEPFEIQPAIAGPVYFPAMGANPYQGSVDPVTDLTYINSYEAPLRIDITNFFKSKFADPGEFSVDLIKLQETGTTTDFTRMGGLPNENEAYRPRIEVTIATTGLFTSRIKTFNAWLSNDVVIISGEAAIYTLHSITGQIIETISTTSEGVHRFNTKLNKGIYIVQSIAGNTVSSNKVAVN